VHGQQQRIRMQSGLTRCASPRVPLRLSSESLQLSLAARIAEDHVVSCSRDDRPELGAHQSGSEDTDAHVYNLSVNVIDYTRDDFTKNGKTYDLIFDVVGATTFDRCQHSLKPNGIFLQNIMELTDVVRVLWTSIASRKKIKGGVAINNLKRMSFIAELVAAGKLRPVIDRSYPLERIAEAFKHVEQGHKKGNVVITVAHS